MFTRPQVLKVHNVNINLPNPYDVYLKGVYGENWKTPNKNFNYYDYFQKKLIKKFPLVTVDCVLFKFNSVLLIKESSVHLKIFLLYLVVLWMSVKL